MAVDAGKAPGRTLRRTEPSCGCLRRSSQVFFGSLASPSGSAPSDPRSSTGGRRSRALRPGGQSSPAFLWPASMATSGPCLRADSETAFAEPALIASAAVATAFTGRTAACSRRRDRAEGTRSQDRAQAPAAPPVSPRALPSSVRRCPFFLSPAAPPVRHSAGSAARQGRTEGQTAFAAYSLEAGAPTPQSSVFLYGLDAQELGWPADSEEVGSAAVGNGLLAARARSPPFRSGSLSR